MGWRSRQYRNYVLRKLKNTKTLIILDTETVGLTKQCQIVQFAASKYFFTSSPVTLKEIDKINCYIRPDQPIPEKVVEKHGITNKFLKDFPDERECFSLIYDFLASDATLIGHNLTFDIDKLQGLYLRNGKVFPYEEFIDTLQMSRDCIDKELIEDYRLSTVTVYWGCDGGISWHNAFDDIKATKRIFLKALERYIISVHEDLACKDRKPKVKLSYAYFWVNPHKKSMQRIRLVTSEGEFFYDTVAKCWGANKKSEYTVDDIDMDDIERQCLLKYQCSDMLELTQRLKNFQKQRGTS